MHQPPQVTDTRLVDRCEAGELDGGVVLAAGLGAGPVTDLRVDAAPVGDVDTVDEDVGNTEDGDGRPS